MRLPLLLLAFFAAACSRDDEREPRGLTPESLARPAENTSGAAVPAEPEVPADAPLVLFLGDSISAGLHVDEHQAFPRVLARTLAADGHPFRLVNAGVSGDTTAGGLARLDWLLKQAPDVLVVELGGNDGLRGQPVAAIEERLRAIVERGQASGARVLVLGVELPPSLGPEYVTGFAELFTRVAAVTGCAFVPSFLDGVGGVAGMMLDDGIHPSVAGHERVAENVAPALHALLEELGGS